MPAQLHGPLLDGDESRFGNDPVAKGREIEKVEPYDPILYAAKDPRLVSNTVVVRDYMCKIPIDRTTPRRWRRRC